MNIYIVFSNRMNNFYYLRNCGDKQVVLDRVARKSSLVIYLATTKY